MATLRPSLALLLLLAACASVPGVSSLGGIDSYSGIYMSPDGDMIELHYGHEGALRGYMRTKDRIAALAPVEVRDGVISANAVFDDGTRTAMLATTAPGPVLMLDGRQYRRSAVETPADATVRRDIEAAYEDLATAVDTKDYAAFQALRVAEFATIPPDGVPSTGTRMAERARGLLQRIQAPITTTNDILELTMRGDDAIATVRQKFTRQQLVEGTPHTIHTEVTQRETWTWTPDGWKLLFVDEERDAITLDNGRRVD